MLLVISSVRAPKLLPIPGCSHLISSRCSDRLAVVASSCPFSGIRVFQLGAANFTMKYVLRHDSIYTFHEAISTLHVCTAFCFFSVLVSKPFLLTDGLSLSTGSWLSLEMDLLKREPELGCVWDWRRQSHSESSQNSEWCYPKEIRLVGHLTKLSMIKQIWGALS